MARAPLFELQVRSFTAHSYSYATEMIDKTHRQGTFAVVELLPRRLLASQVFVKRSQSVYRSNIEPLSVVDRC